MRIFLAVTRVSGVFDHPTSRMMYTAMLSHWDDSDADDDADDDDDDDDDGMLMMLKDKSGFLSTTNPSVNSSQQRKTRSKC